MEILPNEDNDIKLHEVKRVSSWDGRIFHKTATDLVKRDYIVRISMYVSRTSRFDDWFYETDSPYLKVVDIKEITLYDETAEMLLGEVQKVQRMDDDYKYPIRTGDRIWFPRSSIIEIPIEWQAKEEQPLLNELLSDVYIKITGPLYTIDDEAEYSDGPSESSDSGSDSGSESESESESDSDA